MTNEIAKIIPPEANGIALTEKGTIVLRTVGEAAGFAQLMQTGGMLPKGVSPAFAVVAIVAGAQLGLNPFESVQNFAVINGRPSLYGDGLKAVVQGSGAWESEAVEWFKNNEGRRYAVRVVVRRKGVKDPIVGEFTESMAKTAGLWGKSGPWQQYPERMLLARARAFAYRDGFADILKGVRSAEEERDIAATERGEDIPGATAAGRRVRRTTRPSAGEIIEADAEIVSEAPKAIEAPSLAEEATPVEEAEPVPVPVEPPPAPKAARKATDDGDFLLH